MKLTNKGDPKISRFVEVNVSLALHDDTSPGQRTPLTGSWETYPLGGLPPTNKVMFKVTVDVTEMFRSAKYKGIQYVLLLLGD